MWLVQPLSINQDSLELLLEKQVAKKSWSSSSCAFSASATTRWIFALQITASCPI